MVEEEKRRKRIKIIERNKEEKPHIKIRKKVDIHNIPKRRIRIGVSLKE